MPAHLPCLVQATTSLSAAAWILGWLFSPGDAELHREIAGAHQQAVDAGHGGDRFGVLDRLGRLDHHRDQGVVVHRLGHLAERHGRVVELRLAAAHRAMAARG